MIRLFKHSKLNISRLIRLSFLVVLVFFAYALYVTRHHDYRNELYTAFLFYFDSPLSDFKLWFPQYYILVYAAIVISKIVAVSATLAALYFSIKNIQKFKLITNYNHQHSFLPFVLTEAGVLLVVLVVCIAVYYLLHPFIPARNWHIVQLLVSRFFLVHLTAQAISAVLSHYKKLKQYLLTYFLEPGLPYNLAILRILFFLYLIYIYNNRQYFALPIVSLPHKVALPYIGWLVDLIPVNAELYTYACYIGIVSAFLVAVGLYTRLFLIVNAIACFYIMATPNFFGKLWHEQLVVWISWFFAFSNCYDVLSVDALRLKIPVTQRPENTYPVRFFWLQMGVLYFWAGFYKLWDSGFDWALGKSMINQVQLEWLQNYDVAPAIRIDLYPWLLHVGGLLAILFELSYPILVLKKQLRWIAFTCGLVMHNLIGYFMYISFFHLLQVFYIGFFDFNVLFENGKTQKAAPVKALRSYVPIIFIGTIVALNFTCGMLSIDTYPFSAYPKYSALIPDSIKIIKYQPADTSINVFAVGRANNFRWESYGWLEYSLIRDFENGENVQQRIEDYWQIWCNNNPSLAKLDTVSVYLTVRPVTPEGRYNIQTLGLMGRVINARGKDESEQ